MPTLTTEPMYDVMVEKGLLYLNIMQVYSLRHVLDTHVFTTYRRSGNFHRQKFFASCLGGKNWARKVLSRYTYNVNRAKIKHAKFQNMKLKLSEIFPIYGISSKFMPGRWLKNVGNSKCREYMCIVRLHCQHRNRDITPWRRSMYAYSTSIYYTCSNARHPTHGAHDWACANELAVPLELADSL